MPVDTMLRPPNLLINRRNLTKHGGGKLGSCKPPVYPGALRRIKGYYAKDVFSISLIFYQRTIFNRLILALTELLFSNARLFQN